MNETAYRPNPLERRLLDGYQRDFPLEPRPFARIAAALGTTEDAVLEGLRQLQQSGVVSRVGPVLRPRSVGASTLAALAVPEARLQEVAELVSGYREVNHNYQREHRYNLWFVVTAVDRERLHQVLDDIADRTGLEPLDLPMLDEFFIDLGFGLQWS